MIGKIIRRGGSQYKIFEKLGEGSMGMPLRGSEERTVMSDELKKNK